LTSAMTEAIVGADALFAMSENGIIYDFAPNPPCSIKRDEGSIPDDEEVKSLRRDIWISAPRCVEEVLELPLEAGDVCWYHFVLVGRSWKVVAEAATADETVAGADGHNLGVDVLGCSHCGNERTSCWERRKKCACIFTIICDAIRTTAYATITTREDEGRSSSS